MGLTPSRALLFGVWIALCPPAGAVAEAAEVPQLAASEIAFAEGLLAYQDGDYVTASDRFADAARFNPAVGSPHYWRGLALLRLGRAREAAAELAASLEARRPPEVERQRVISDLATAREAAEGEPVRIELPEWRDQSGAIDDRGLWEGNVVFSTAADSNPNLLSEELILPRPRGSQDLIRGGEADTAARLHTRLAVYPFHAREAPNLGVMLEARRSVHRDFGFLDLGQLRGTVQLAYGSDPLGYLTGPLGHTRAPFGVSQFTALLQAGGTSYQLGGDPYLQIWEVVSSLAFLERSTTATRLDADFAHRDFSDQGLADVRRSGEDLSVQLSQLVFFGRRDRYLRVGARAVDRQAGRMFSESILEENAEVAWPVGLRWSLRLEGRYRADDFDAPQSDLFDPAQGARDDRTVRGALTVVWSATERLRWVARATYVRRNSSVDLGDGLPDLDYRRRIVSVGVSWVF